MFEQLYDSYKNGELILLDGGFCRFHIKKGGQLTIYEILSQKKGVGKKIIDILLSKDNISSIFAKCPEDLPSNKFYEKMGFILEGKEETKSKRKLNLWRKIK